MQSPFPGMDPFIEACGLWEGFHSRLIHLIDQTLARKLPPGYSIDTAVRSYVVLVQGEGKKESLTKSDVTITEPAHRKRPKKKGGGVAVALPPDVTEMEAFIAKEYKEHFVEIYVEGEERYLVTSIEVLSPSNKHAGSKGWRRYLRNRQGLLQGQANLVEIDLLRGGKKFPMLTAWPECPYTLLVGRADSAPTCRVWSASFHTRLPVIPIPLEAPDSDLPLDLQPLVNEIYSFGRYHERIDYTRPLSSKFSKADARLLKETLKQHVAGTSGAEDKRR